ncbi:rSAM-modified peptide [Flavobacterium sp. JAS]|uniref:rSAM-modified peptide n=1 Tax=Flavobacterium sp. JAS TaxID=2897329 RepID=UPI001E3257BD|nr:rSAM-modified peptide [Flavobacterium sp. JAS]MCD0472697.1 rSAM-modified peptide [Flavobacterium sp. JAS]
MANQALKLEDFGAQKLSKNQQKIVRGGDGEACPPPQESDPGKSGTGNNGTS